MDQRLMINPYNQPRQLQFRHEGSTKYYNPYNFTNKPGREHEMNPQGLQEYSQEYYPPFDYNTQSQEYIPFDPNRPQDAPYEDRIMQDTENSGHLAMEQDPEDPSRPAEDALTYHPV
jgi:hypothetical protein